MNDTLLLQQAYPNMPPAEDYMPMLKLTKARHFIYCELHAMDFQCVESASSPKYADVHEGGWGKIELIIRALEQGYRQVIWLDSDAMIKDLSADLRDGCVNGIGVCWHRIPQLNHWNTGVMYFRNTPDVIDFCSEWLAGYPGDKTVGWAEQGIFNKLAKTSRVVQTISDRWNATLNYSMVPDAVVLGFHGYGTPPERFEAMKVTLQNLEAREGVR